ncbi:MAG: aminobenzoyl-glutamate utilization protein B [Pirellulaceae bacterium]|jgi:aminobenzoyl-glutamate utilization protein B
MNSSRPRTSTAQAAVASSIVCWLLLANFGFAQRDELLDSIVKQESEAWKIASDIWGFAEPGYQETKSSAVLAQWLTKSGFRVETGVADIPTSIVATYGAGAPVIGILGEFDALPGLSQQGVPVRQPAEGRYGHGCGHHLFGAASANAAIALKRQIESGQLKGTIRFYGCPAEEGGSAKVFMVQAGLFDDCDTVLHWHPSHQNSAGDRSSLARIAVKFRFHGKSAHAAGQPEEGRSALDAVELTNYAAELLREHVPEQARIHHVITAGGLAPNVVPDFAEVYFYVRHPKAEVVRGLYQRLVLCAKAGALATETKLEIKFEGGIVEILPNNTLAQIALKNLRELNDLKYTKEEIEFALRIQQTFSQRLPLDEVERVTDQSGTISRGSTDVGDVSWVVPTTGFSASCWVPGTPGHSWQAVACGIQPFARRGMTLASRVLAATAWDLMKNPRLIAIAKQEHRKRTGAMKYTTLMLRDQKPPLDYRNPPK